MANCSSCAKKRKEITSQSTAPGVVTNNVAAQTVVAQRGINTMNDSDYVLVLYTHPNKGRHGVVGADTKKNYGYRAGGDQFLVHRRDVAAQPQFYRIIQSAERVSVKQPTPPIPPPPVLKATIPPPPKRIKPILDIDEAAGNVVVEKPATADDNSEHLDRLQNIVDSAKQKRTLDLGMLPGVTPAIENNLRAAGIVTVDDFKAAGVDGLMDVKFIGKNKAEVIMAYIETIP